MAVFAESLPCIEGGEAKATEGVCLHGHGFPYAEDSHTGACCSGGRSRACRGLIPGNARMPNGEHGQVCYRDGDARIRVRLDSPSKASTLGRLGIDLP